MVSSTYCCEKSHLRHLAFYASIFVIVWFVNVCVIKFVSTISYKLLVGISPNVWHKVHWEFHVISA